MKAGTALLGLSFLGVLGYLAFSKETTTSDEEKEIERTTDTLKSYARKVIANPGEYDPDEVKHELIPLLLDNGLDIMAVDVEDAMVAEYGDSYVRSLER